MVPQIIRLCHDKTKTKVLSVTSTEKGLPNTGLISMQLVTHSIESSVDIIFN